MIKAIIFDFFGVIVTEGTGSFARTYYPSDQEKIALTQKLQDEVNLGLISYKDYAEGLARLAGVEVEVAQKYLEGHRPNLPLLDYIRHQSKAKYKIGMISNAGDDWVDEILAKEDAALFDDIVLSYKSGYIKPQPEIYELSLKNLGVDPAEAVFIDDIDRYCDAANAVGMKAILYKNFDQMKIELEAILAAGADD